MTDTPTKNDTPVSAGSASGSGRLAGGTLRFAAWLAETPLTGSLVKSTAIKRLGLVAMRELSIPRDIPIYRPSHLRPCGAAPSPGPGERP